MQEDNLDNDEEFQLPPVQLPQGPPVIQKPSAKELLVTVPNLFKEEIIKIDDSSIDSLEFLNDGSLMAIGCGNGSIKVLSIAQGTSSLRQETFNIYSKAKTILQSLASRATRTALTFGTPSWPPTQKEAWNTGMLHPGNCSFPKRQVNSYSVR